MKTWNERLKHTVEKSEVKAAHLAKAVGVSSATVSDWLNGVIKKIDGENLIKCCSFLRVNPEWIMFGKYPISNGLLVSQNNATYSSKEYLVPVLNWSDVLDYHKNINEIHNFQYPQHVICPINHGRKTYVLTIESENMLPEYTIGTHIYVDPEELPRNEDHVLMIDDDGKVIFREYKIGYDGVYAISLNRDWPNRIKPLNDFYKILGVVIYSGKKRGYINL